LQINDLQRSKADLRVGFLVPGSRRRPSPRDIGPKEVPAREMSSSLGHPGPSELDADRTNFPQRAQPGREFLHCFHPPRRAMASPLLRRLAPARQRRLACLDFRPRRSCAGSGAASQWPHDLARSSRAGQR